MNKKEITEPLRAQVITGVNDELFNLLQERIETEWEHSWALPGGRPPALDLSQALAVTLAYMRTGVTQQFLAAIAGCSQSTISRTITILTPVLSHLLQAVIPTIEQAQETVQNSVVLVDGTLCPTWSWKGNKKMWNGKHKTTGYTSAIVTTRCGQLIYASPPHPGSVHDKKVLDSTAAKDICNAAIDTIADKGYIGTEFLTPRKSSKNRPLTDADHQFNTQINSVRAPVERAIAHLKTWRVLHTDYRRPLHTWPDTYQTILGIQFLKQTTPAFE